MVYLVSKDIATACWTKIPAPQCKMVAIRSMAPSLVVCRQFGVGFVFLLASRNHERLPLDGGTLMRHSTRLVKHRLLLGCSSSNVSALRDDSR
jgi:hypothetical protein